MCGSSGADMATDQSTGKLDRWRKISLAILENGLVVPWPDKTQWIEWTEESASNGNLWIAEDDIAGFYFRPYF
jgi:hypothetical protein